MKITKVSNGYIVKKDHFNIHVCTSTEALLNYLLFEFDNRKPSNIGKWYGRVIIEDWDDLPKPEEKGLTNV